MIRSLLVEVARPTLTYGFSDDAAYHISQVKSDRLQTTFIIDRPDNLASLQIILNIPGRHNVLNAAAAIAVASDEGISDAAIIRGLKEFGGVGRRFEIVGNYPVKGGSAMLVDDYGHHPTELKATIEAVRSGWPDKRLVMIFQPHRYTRTRDLYEDFVEVLCEVDVLLILDVYSAGEDVIAGASSKNLCGSIRQRGKVDPIYAPSLEAVPDLIAGVVKSEDIVLTQGAGSVTQLVTLLTETELGRITL